MNKKKQESIVKITLASSLSNKPNIERDTENSSNRFYKIIGKLISFFTNDLKSGVCWINP